MLWNTGGTFGRYNYTWHNGDSAEVAGVLLPVECRNGVMLLRSRRVHDYVRTVGGTKRLKEIFSQKKIPESRRDEVPVLDIDGDIAAVFFSVLGYRDIKDSRYGNLDAGSGAMIIRIADGA